MAIMNLNHMAYSELIDLAFFVSFTALVVYPEIKSLITLIYWVCKRIAAGVNKIVSVLKDYRSARYYKPWKPTAPIIIVSTKKQIGELSEAACLSQRAVYADMFGFKHTLNNLQHNTSDHKVIRTRLYSRMLQVNGPDHLKFLFPYFISRLDDTLGVELRSGLVLDEGISLPLAQTVRRLASKVMSIMFFGEILASDEEFSKALLCYPRDMVRCMAAFQITPSLISPIVHSLLTNRGKAMRVIQKRLLECMGEGRSTWSEPEITKRHTIMHNMTEMTGSSDYWNPELLSQSLLGIWFAAAHQPWMNLHFVMIQLCIRKDCQISLRQELKRRAPLNYEKVEQLPLLDSFIKETVRLNPLDTLAIRRKALEPFTFADGDLSIPIGATVCVSAYNLLHDPDTYYNPDTFDPARFVPQDHHNPQQKFTNVSEKFPVWGYGSLACPGRFHASLVIKMVVSQLLLKYDLALKDENARTRWSWETFTMPYESTQFILRKL